MQHFIKKLCELLARNFDCDQVVIRDNQAKKFYKYDYFINNYEISNMKNKFNY